MRIEHRLRETLARGVNRVEPSTDAWSSIEHRLEHSVTRRATSRVLAAILALAISGASLFLVWVGFRPTAELPQGGAAGSASELEPTLTASIDVGSYPVALALGEGGVWVVVDSPQQTPSFSLVEIDPSTNAIQTRVPLGEGGEDVAVGAGAVWTISYEKGMGFTLLRIDPREGKVADVIPLDCDAEAGLGGCHATAVAANESSVWVTTQFDPAHSGEVLQIDPVTNEVAARIAFEGWPRDIVVHEGSAWVLSLTEFDSHDGVRGASIQRIDIDTARVVSTILAGQLGPEGGAEAYPPVMAIGGGSLWTATGTRSSPKATRFDVAANVIDGSTSIDFFAPFAVAEGGVWFVSRDPATDRASISRLNEELVVDETVILDSFPIDAALDSDHGVIWTANYRHSISRVDL